MAHHSDLVFSGRAMPERLVHRPPKAQRDGTFLLMGIFFLMIAYVMWRTAMGVGSADVVIVVPTPPDTSAAYAAALSDFSTAQARENPPTPRATLTPTSSVVPTTDPLVGLPLCDDEHTQAGEVCSPLLLQTRVPTPYPLCTEDDYKDNTFRIKPCRKPFDPPNPFGRSERQELAPTAVAAFIR